MLGATIRSGQSRRRRPGSFRPWQFFVLMSLAIATVAVLISQQPTPEHLVLISLAIGAAGFWRCRLPHAGASRARTAAARPSRLSAARASLEREKTLELRSIKELEFDRAMGKIAQADFDEMTARLRARALVLMEQLERGAQGAQGPAQLKVLKVLLSARASTVPAFRRVDACAGAVRERRRCRFCKRCGLKCWPRFSMSRCSRRPTSRRRLQMPDPKQMSGVPLPVRDLPNGTVSVRVVRAGRNNLQGETVEVTVAGRRSLTEDGRQRPRAVFRHRGGRRRAGAGGRERGERSSLPFPMPYQGGIRLMLVATDPEAARRQKIRQAGRRSGAAGIVIFGGESRFVIEHRRGCAAGLLSAQHPEHRRERRWRPRAPVVFDLPTGARRDDPRRIDGPRARLGRAGHGHRSVSARRNAGPGRLSPCRTRVEITLAQKMPVALEQVLIVAEKSSEVRIASPRRRLT